MHVRIQLYVPAALPREGGLGTHSALVCKNNGSVTEENVVLYYIIAQKLTDGLGRGYIEARTDTTQQSGQTPDKEVEIKNITVYVSGYTEGPDSQGR